MKPHRTFLRRSFLGVWLTGVALGALLGAGCNPTSARAGVGLGPALLYRHSTVPFTARRPDFRRGETGIIIPAQLTTSKVVAHQVQISIPGVTPPGPSNPLSVGWGDISQARLLEEGGVEEVVFADATELSILGIYTRLTITAYADAQPRPPGGAEVQGRP